MTTGWIVGICHVVMIWNFRVRGAKAQSMSEACWMLLLFLVRRIIVLVFRKNELIIVAFSGVVDYNLVIQGRVRIACC